MSFLTKLSSQILASFENWGKLIEKITMKFLYITFIFSFLFGGDSSVETVTFDVIMRNKKVGELIATKTVKSDLVVYKSATKIKTQILKEINVDYDFDVTFHKNILIKSNANILVNGRVQDETSVQWNGKEYQVTYHKNRQKSFSDSIYYSSIMLLFDEPITDKISFSEQDGTFHKIKEVEKNGYEKINQKGRINKYFYKNGKLKLAEINAGLIKFQIAVPESYSRVRK